MFFFFICTYLCLFCALGASSSTGALGASSSGSNSMSGAGSSSSSNFGWEVDQIPCQVQGQSLTLDQALVRLVHPVADQTQVQGQALTLAQALVHLVHLEADQTLCRVQGQAH
jgi:hypothetical protein